MRRALFIGILGVLTAVLGAMAETPAPFVVIVNSGNPVASASRATISGMFLKRVGKWQGGIRSQPVDLVESSKTREAFSQRLLGRRTSEVEQQWQSAIFSGDGIPPPKKATEAEVVAFVAQHAGGIGYVSATTPLTPRVKILSIEP
jgi:ABC-type phosphate transport system substrate-binding protein